MMNRLVSVVAAVSAVVMSSASFGQAETEGRGFIGIWQLVDNGVMVTADISDVDGDGQYRYHVHVDFNPLCNKDGEYGRQRATPMNLASVNASGDLVVEVKIECALTERVLEERTPITLRLVDDNTLLNVTRDAPFHRMSVPVP